MPFSTPPFIPQFGVGAPVLGHVPPDQLYFDTSATPYQGYVFNRSLGLWEQFGGGGGGGFPTTENVNSTHAGIVLGQKNISYITTDGSGTPNNVTLPTPPPDAGANSAFWNNQWHVVVLKTRTNAADTVVINTPTPPVVGSFSDPRNQPYASVLYNQPSLILSAVGEQLAFRWNGVTWNFDYETSGEVTHTPVVNPTDGLGINGASGNSYVGQSHGQSIYALSGGGYTGSNGYGGYVLLRGGNGAGTGDGGSVQGYAGNGGALANGGNVAFSAGNSGGLSSSYHGGNVSLSGGYGYYGGNVTVYSGPGDPGLGGKSGNMVLGTKTGSKTSGSVTIQTGDGIGGTYGSTGDLTIKTGQPVHTGTAGTISITAGGATTGAFCGDVDIGSGSGVGADCGNIFIQGGLQTGGSGTNKGGNIVIQTEFDNVVGDDIGSIAIQTGGTLAGHANIGSILIATGQNPITNPNTALQPGNGSIVLDVVGNPGASLDLDASIIKVPDLGAVDPAIANALWLNHGILTVSGSGTAPSFAGGVTVGTAAQAISSSVAFTNGAGAGAGTLTNAPAAGNPTKWIGINDNGTLRHFPCW